MPSDEPTDDFDLNLEELPIALPVAHSSGQERSTPYSFQHCWTIGTLC